MKQRGLPITVSVLVALCTSPMADAQSTDGNFAPVKLRSPQAIDTSNVCAGGGWLGGTGSDGAGGAGCNGAAGTGAEGTGAGDASSGRVGGAGGSIGAASTSVGPAAPAAAVDSIGAAGIGASPGAAVVSGLGGGEFGRRLASSRSGSPSYSLRSLYYRCETFRSTADCLTAAYTQPLPLEVC
jgi:hypothetical protein